jgi:hypothetical protein
MSNSIFEADKSQFGLYQGDPPEAQPYIQKETQQDVPRSQNIFNYTLTVATQLIALPKHYGVIVVNSGGDIVQFSPDGSNWLDWLQVSSTTGMDNHQMPLFFLRAKTTSTTIQVITW